jgi:hypothetical protein
MNQDRDRLEMIMEMFHQFGQTMISADTLEKRLSVAILRPTASLVIGRRHTNWAKP